MDSALGYISLAKKAGAIQIGETKSGAAIRAGKAKLLVLAADASGNAEARALSFAKGRGLAPVRLPFTKREISQATNTPGCSMAVFTDKGLAEAFMRRLEEEEL
jgi:ribosomal protein L7Ae-like RNA K-turn-binding protein